MTDTKIKPFGHIDKFGVLFKGAKLALAIEQRPLYDEAALEAARKEGMRDALTYAGISERYMKDVLVLDLRAKLQVATEAIESTESELQSNHMREVLKEALAKIKGEV